VSLANSAVFENSVTGSVKDTLIGARQELESRWRRLTFYLPPEEVDSDDTLTAQVCELCEAIQGGV
jgi:hypothetical protein